MKYITLLLSAVVFTAGCGLYTACKKDCPTQPPPVTPWHNTLQLQATFISIRWAQLQWHNDSIAVSHYYVLLRNNKDTVYADSVNYRDSVVTVKDSGLQPGTPYTYTLYRVYNRQNWDTSTVAITTLAITNPNLIFDNTFFGENGGSSYLRGVWASSPTDVWMCGEIDSVQASGKIYNVVHYDMTGFHFGYEGLGGTLEGVYGVDSGDVWFCGGNAGTYVEHYSNGQWTDYNISGDTTILGHSITQILVGIYATPDKQWVYTVGNGGTILRLNRATNKWEQMQSPTKYDFRDIIGFGDNALYALGIGQQNGYGVVVKYDGTSWGTLAQSVPNPNDSMTMKGNINGISGFSPDSLYVVGDHLNKQIGENWLDVTPKNTGTITFMEDVYAQAWNRVFVCGDFLEILLWNGEQWYNLGGGPSTAAFERIFAVGNDVYAVGLINDVAILQHGHY
ncbi:MAG TPA: hypothetical protein VFA55_01965 [Candidatus Kapabacteria bacterium]|nr:hypothetical protein [Candidatus Kapabacteria bacterium]